MEVTFSPNLSNTSEVNDSLPMTSDIDAFLVATLGPKRLPLNWLIPLTSVYLVIFMTGLVGNICTCLVIARNQYMQTATNCYLFNLAIADMLTLLCAMPMELYTLWQQYPWGLGNTVCELRAIIPEATTYASILTIVTFSSERYIAICHPIRQQTKSTLSHAIRNIIIIWLVSLAGATPYGVFTRVNYLVDPRGQPILQSAWCGFPFNDPHNSWQLLILCSTFLFFVVPMTLIIALYIRIAMTLQQSRTLQRCRSEGGTTTEGERSKVQSRRVVVRMLIAVVIAFFICWAPFHAQRLLFLYVSLYGEWTEQLRKINQDLFSLAGCFYYFNSTINPILYSVMSNRFRVAFREKLCTGPPTLWCLCCCCFCWWRRDYGSRTQRITIYRNSHSQSSVRSNVSFNNKLKTNNSFPRLRSMGSPDSATWIKNTQYATMSLSNSGRYGSNLTVLVTPDLENSSSDRRSREFDEELQKAIKPDIARLVEKDGGCVNCTDCSLLFPPKSNKIHLFVRSSTSDLSRTKSSSDIMESNV